MILHGLYPPIGIKSSFTLPYSHIPGIHRTPLNVTAPCAVLKSRGARNMLPWEKAGHHA